MFRLAWLVTAVAVWVIPAWGAAEEDITIRTVLFPMQQAILAAAVESSVTRVALHEGESFKTGDVLLEFDDGVFQQRLNKARSTYSQAELDLEYARKNLQRSKDLLNDSMTLISNQEFDKAVLDHGTAIARKAYQEAECDLAERDLENCKVRAPFNGRLVKWLIKEHEYARPGQVLVQILDDTKILAAMHLPSSARSRVRIGAPLEISVDDDPALADQRFPGEVYEISGDIDASSRTFEVKVLIDNADGRLISGMSGRLLTDLNTLPVPEAK